MISGIDVKLIYLPFNEQAIIHLFNSCKLAWEQCGLCSLVYIL